MLSGRTLGKQVVNMSEVGKIGHKIKIYENIFYIEVISYTLDIINSKLVRIIRAMDENSGNIYSSTNGQN